MTFEEVVKLYLKTPTKKFGNKKSPAAHSTLTWMCSKTPEGLRDPETRKVYKYSKYLLDKNPRRKIIWDDTSGMFKGRDMKSINSADVTKMEILLRCDKGLSEAGINNYLRYLRALCYFAKKRLAIKFEDFPDFELGTEEERVEWLEPEEALKLIRWLDPLRADMVRFALATGLRNANVTLMKWEYWNPKTRDIIIPKKEMKNGSSHHLIVTKSAKEVLQNRLKVRERLLKDHPSLAGKLDYVFVQTCQRSLGKPFFRTSVCNKTWKRAVSLAGLPSWVRFHSLRHTFASWLADADVHADVRQKLTGHQSAGVHGRYSHHDEALDRAVAQLPDI